MKRFTVDIHLLILIWISYEFHFKFSDSFEWKEIPNPTTHAKIDSPLQVYWEYNLSTNEELYEIEFFKNGQEMYSKMNIGGPFRKYSKNLTFQLTGDRLVTYSNSNISSGDEGIHCLKIKYTLKGQTDDNQIREKEKCTVLQPFAFPYVTYITSNLTTKQGKLRSLQCNASGIPKPGINWIKVQSHLKNTKVTYKSQFWLNITGKMSGGRYCCQVSNRYGKDTKCSYIKVTEYQPARTVFTSRNDYTVRNTAFQVSCKADSSPPARYIIKDGGKIVGNSTDETFNITRQCEENFINISCTAGNAYGKGDTKYLHLPIYESPVIINHSNTNTLMTTNNITLRCNATGNPKPDIIWRYDNNVTRNDKGLDGELNIIYECCENKTFLYYCRASNRVMTTKEYLITVEAIRYNCREKKGTEKSNGMCDQSTHILLDDSADNDLAMIVGLIVSVLVIVIIVLVLCILVSMKRNHPKRQMIRGQSQSSRNQYIEESPYGDPVDAIQVNNPNYTSASNADYATVEETGYKRRSDVNRLPKVKNTTYATVEDSNDKKEPKVEALYAKVNKNYNNKNKISDMPLVTLPEEISDNSSKTTNVSGNTSSPSTSQL